MTKYLINSIGLALVAAGQSMIASAADMADISGSVELIQGGAGLSPASIANVELDKDGLPWDERLHASTKTKTQPGMWTKKKGVAEADAAKIIAELRQKYPAPAADSTGAPGTLQLPGIPLPNLTPPTNYGQLCKWLADNTGEGKRLTTEYVEGAFKAQGTALASLATNEDLAGQWLEAFKGVLASLGG